MMYEIMHARVYIHLYWLHSKNPGNIRCHKNWFINHETRAPLCFPHNCHMLAYIQNSVVFKVDSKVAVKSHVARLPCEIFAVACCFAIEPCINWHISYFLRVEEGTLSRTLAFDWDADMLKKSML